MVRSRTDELLLYFFRRDPDGTGTTGVGELSSGDWDDLLYKSALHHVTPMLYHRLTIFHPGAQIPAEVLQKLRISYLHSAGRNMRLYHEVGKVLGRLRQHRIPVIALKGTHLAIAVYRNIALRPMADVDLLVKQTDLLKVQEILVEQGYFASREEVFCSQVHLAPYKRKDSISIEIHFNIAAPPLSERVDVEKLFARAQTCFIEGIEVLSLCPEDLLLHLCMHASYQHGFDNGIMPLVDISTTVEHYRGDLDWEQVLSRIEEWGVRRCVCLALSLAENIMGASIPDKIRVKMDAYRDVSNAIILAEDLLFGRGTAVPQNIARLFNNNRLREKLMHLLNRAFPPIKTIADMNPRIKNRFALYFVYYFRIKGLFARHVRTIGRLFLRDREMLAFVEVENRRNELKDWLAQ
jgi:Uncharacterised nucleotidyltransferase